jgi:hypothetical protein
VITNVPGPSRPIYLLGSRMLDVYPLVPLAVTQALGIALVTYDQGLHWGFNADWEAIPDLHELVMATGEELEQLCKLASAGAKPAAKKTRRR